MGSVPTTVNQPAQTVDQIINGAIFDLAVAPTAAAMEAAFPFLALPVVKQLFEKALSVVANYFYKTLAIATTINIVIPAETAIEKNAYVKAESELRAAHLSGDPAALAKATADFRAAAQRFIHFDGAASP